MGQNGESKASVEPKLSAETKTECKSSGVAKTECGPSVDADMARKASLIPATSWFTPKR